MLHAAQFKLVSAFNAAQFHCYGYHSRDLVADRSEPRIGSKIVDKPSFFYRRLPMLTSLGMHFRLSVPPYPDIRDMESLKLGCIKRFMCRSIPINRRTYRQFRSFVRIWLAKNMTPLAFDTDLSLETWLSETNYPEWRKDELRKALEASPALRLKHRRCKSFGKREHYPSFKHPRAINSRSDRFKVATGPFFHALEKALFKNPYFIKKVPVCDRSRYVSEHVTGSVFAATDHSSFEGHISPEIMRVCELAFYSFMSRLLPRVYRVDLMREIYEALSGLNICSFPGFVASVIGSRMSGDMCTSLGNGFTNLMVTLFLAFRKSGRFPPGVVEGDDGLFGYRSEAEVPTDSDYAELGFSIKRSVFQNVGKAGFCSNYFTESGNNVTDVREPMARLGWTEWCGCPNKETQDGLLRAKCFSLLYEYPACPILRSLALHGLRRTAGSKPRYSFGKMSWWDEQVMKSVNSSRIDELVRTDISVSDRELVFELSGISPEEQKGIERALDNDTYQFDIVPNAPQAWVRFADLYCVRAGA